MTVNNVAPISGGRDEESDAERAARFLQFVQALSRGPIASIEYGARQVRLVAVDGSTTERVVDARAYERYLVDYSTPPGYVDLYIYNGGSGASGALVTEAQKIIDGYVNLAGDRVMGYKAAGIVLRTYPVSLTTINVAMTVRTEGAIPLTAAQTALMDDAISRYINDVKIGGTVYKSEQEAAALSVDGILDARLSGGDTAISLSSKAVVGTIAYTVAAA